MADAPLRRNPLSIAGAALTTVSAVGFVVYLLLDTFGYLPGPYAGLFGYLFVPAVFVIGLLLIPLGMWREARRRRRGHGPWAFPVIDISRSRTRWTLALLGVLTVVNIGIVAVASVSVVHYTESNKFCGQVCHTPMTPQFTAHAVSPHANVECVSCHVSPGSGGFVKAKMNGTRQLWLLMTGGYDRPIAEPIGRIPTANNTCANCHVPGRPNRDMVRSIPSYADDEKSTESVTTLTLLMKANHWHARTDVEVDYVASDDKRETIPYVRVKSGGQVTEYFAENTTAQPAGAVNRMDCIDCHNRPAHTFSPSADRAVDVAIAAGSISRDLPFVRREVLSAVKAEYSSHEKADAGIAADLKAFYSAAPAGQVDAAVAAAQKLYRQNVFPEMKVTWGTYMSKLGHVDVPGCFRCHDDTHKATDGRVIRQDCALCHKIN